MCRVFALFLLALEPLASAAGNPGDHRDLHHGTGKRQHRADLHHGSRYRGEVEGGAGGQPEVR